MIPVVTGLVTGSTGGLTFDPNSGGLSNGQVASLVAAFGSLVVGSQLQSIGLLFVSGMIAHVTSAAAVGRKLTMGEAWAATRGKRWRLLGMALMLGLVVLLALALVAGILLVGIFAFDAPLGDTIVVGVLLGLLLVVAWTWFWVRVQALAVPTLMLEPVGVFGALRRSVRLTQQQFWRLLGILLLMALIVGFAGSILRAPFSIVGELFLLDSADGGSGLLIYLLLTAVGAVVSAAVLHAVPGRRQRPALRRPADPQGGVRRGAARPRRDPARLMLAPLPPLDPSGDEGRRLLRAELLHREYHHNLWQRLLGWLARLFDRGVGAASGLSAVTVLVTLLIGALLLVGLLMLLSRLRRDRRQRLRPAAVLTHDRLPAAELRRRAEASLAQGRHEEAVVDAFRAIATRQIERGRLDDQPGATAHEVAARLAASYPQESARVGRSADLFDATLYGDRPATHDDASAVLGLDDTLAGAR